MVALFLDWTIEIFRHIGAETKWSPFSWHFQMDFLKWKWWLDYRRIYVSLGLNKLNHAFIYTMKYINQFTISNMEAFSCGSRQQCAMWDMDCRISFHGLDWWSLIDLSVIGSVLNIKQTSQLVNSVFWVHCLISLIHALTKISLSSNRLSSKSFM